MHKINVIITYQIHGSKGFIDVTELPIPIQNEIYKEVDLYIKILRTNICTLHPDAMNRLSVLYIEKQLTIGIKVCCDRQTEFIEKLLPEKGYSVIVTK